MGLRREKKYTPYFAEVKLDALYRLSLVQSDLLLGNAGDEHGTWPVRNFDWQPRRSESDLCGHSGRPEGRDLVAMNF